MRDASRRPDFDDWIREWILAPATQEEYLEKLGRERLAALVALGAGKRPDPAPVDESTGVTANERAAVWAAGLLAERISIRDLPLVLEALGEGLSVTQSIVLLVEHVRTRLARQISTACTAESGHIPIVTLSPAWEQAFAAALVGQGDERQLAMAPSELQRFVQALREALEKHAMEGELPVVVTSPVIRPFVRAVVERFRPSTVVLSQNEIHPKARIRTLGQI